MISGSDFLPCLGLPAVKFLGLEYPLAAATRLRWFAPLADLRGFALCVVDTSFPFDDWPP